MFNVRFFFVLDFGVRCSVSCVRCFVPILTDKKVLGLLCTDYRLSTIDYCFLVLDYQVYHLKWIKTKLELSNVSLY